MIDRKAYNSISYSISIVGSLQDRANTAAAW